MQILNIAGYKFVSLSELASLRAHLLSECAAQELKGTILLSEEGINLSLAGKAQQIEAFQKTLKGDLRFLDLSYRYSYSAFLPFKRLKVKIKKEIITLRKPEINPETFPAPMLSPAEFKKWLDERRDMTILDTRNDYEIQFGTFQNAVNLKMDDFTDFPEAVKKINPKNPIVMFCTGGIRCEKAAVHLINQGVSKVYQLQGGILNYFAQVGGDYYQGDCFVFDERVAVKPNLEPSHITQCPRCEGPREMDIGEVCQKCLNLKKESSNELKTS